MLHAYDVLYYTLLDTRQTPKLNITDNEASTTLKRLLQKDRAVAQLAPPHSHKRNSVERAIHNFMNDFVSGLASVDNNFPIYLWCRMVKQSYITINSLITLITNPRLSEYKIYIYIIFGKYFSDTIWIKLITVQWGTYYVFG